MRTRPTQVLSTGMRTLPLAVIATALAACALPVDPVPGPTAPSLITSLPRVLTGNEIKVRDAVNEFSFSLFSTVSNDQKTQNTFVSPLSASFALGMTMNGAATQTLAEMNAALRLNGMTQQEINSGFKSLTDLLLSLDATVQIRLANSIWYRNTFTFNQPFFDSTAKYFGATIKPLNFNDQTTSLAAINGWVKTATNDRIEKVLDRIDPLEVMFLMNAIYFKGSWRDRFDTRNTTSRSFGALSGEQQPVSLMVKSADILYAETAAYQAVDLPYGNGAFSMTVVMPRAGNDINVVAASFTRASWKTLTDGLRSVPVNLAMPRLTLSYERLMNRDLKSLGMNLAFDANNADFSRMSPWPVYLTFVKQNSFVEVNEQGTEAAAVTTVGVGTVSANTPKTMLVDGPYMFVIRERLSGTVMFMGRIVRMPS